MGSYYYLMAQVPGVLPGAPVILSSKGFRELAERFLSAADRRVLVSLSLEPPRDGSPVTSRFLREWYSRERSLRLALSRVRAARLKREANLTMLEDEDVRRSRDALNVAKAAVAFDNPLAAERYLETVRSSWVDELSVGHYFDSDAVFAYAVRLLLRERTDRFTAEAGREAYSAIYNQILGEEA